ncbi:hypothetical protein BDV35DRAFT_389943 [Aspergillus flavus]|uniref:Uncharacterized protein n=1 Tax=Aspergillus flavus TaxID=5059 RepID=A0A5N6H7H5_ASPFL|nr:hypothetical protein BDV35DRAFT_389943 [Aspergillus flavus]
MEPVTESRDRYNLRKELTLMERDIKALEEANTHTLDQSVLHQCRVRALPLTPDADDSLTPKEYNTDRLALSSECGRLIYIYLQSYVRKLMIDFPEIRRMWSSNQIGDYNFPNLYRMLEPEFGTLSIFHVAKASKPHIKRIMHNDLGVDDSHLLRGEVLTVIRIMLGQLKQKVFVSEMVAPVLLFSLNRRHPRVIEAYFDGLELLVRRTKPYDFTFLNAAGFKTFAQWLLGNPIGDTFKRTDQTYGSIMG